MTYDITDAKQSALGVTVAILLIVMIRAGDPITINPSIGLVVGLIWLYITGKPFITKGMESKKHFMFNILVAGTVAAGISYIFEMVTLEQLTTFQYFGSSAWLFMLLGITSAQFYDKMNITNLYNRWYHRRR